MGEKEDKGEGSRRRRGVGGVRENSGPQHLFFMNAPSYSPFTLQLTARWKLRTRGTSYTFIFRNVIASLTRAHAQKEESGDKREGIDWSDERVVSTALSRKG